MVRQNSAPHRLGRPDRTIIGSVRQPPRGGAESGGVRFSRQGSDISVSGKWIRWIADLVQEESRPADAGPES
jgi:hypothetical protein